MCVKVSVCDGVNVYEDYEYVHVHEQFCICHGLHVYEFRMRI